MWPHGRTLFFPFVLSSSRRRARARLSPRAYRADWQLESLGYALVREFLPCEEQERLALAVRQRLDRVGHPREQHARVERPGVRAPVRRLQTLRHPRARAQPSGLATPVLQQQVRADPV